MNNIDKNTTYNQRPGTLVIFPVPADKKETEKYNFFGTLVTIEGEEKYLRMYTRTSKDDKVFLVGHVGTKEEIKEKGNDVDTKKPNTVALFLNEKYVPAKDLPSDKKEQPYYSGVYLSGDSNEYNVALWLKMGKKGEFFSGVYNEKKEKEAAEADFSGVEDKGDAPF